jgi:hypothetical protein
MAGNPYASVDPRSFFARERLETPDSMYDGAAGAGRARVASTAHGAAGKTPLSVTELAHRGAVDHSGMLSTVGQMADGLGLEMHRQRVTRDAMREEHRAFNANKASADMAIHAARATAVPEHYRIKALR